MGFDKNLRSVQIDQWTDQSTNIWSVQPGDIEYDGFVNGRTNNVTKDVPK